MALAVGEKAPNFTLKRKTETGLVDVKLSDHFGHQNSVLLFFPGAFTGVCTDQLCDATGGLGHFVQTDAAVYAISPDSPFALDAWAKQEGISVPLLSDYQGKTIAAYDVVIPDFVGLGPGSQRAVFVIDKQGIIRYAETTPTLQDLPSNDRIIETLNSLP